MLPKQASPVRPQIPEADSKELAPPRANLGPPPPLIQPKGRLEVQQADRLSTELDALQRGEVTARTPVVEVRTLSWKALHCSRMKGTKHCTKKQGALWGGVHYSSSYSTF